MPFWMQSEDPEYYPEGPLEEAELEDEDNILTDDIPYFGA